MTRSKSFVLMLLPLFVTLTLLPLPNSITPVLAAKGVCAHLASDVCGCVGDCDNT